MKNTHFIKLGGLLALVSFLFLPVAGCGSLTFSGIDVMKMKDISAMVKLFAGFAMICAVAVVFLPDKTLVFFSAIGGFISLIIAYLIAKGKMSSGNDLGMSDVIDLKSGAYLSMIGFAVSAVVSKLKNELLGNQPINQTPPSQDKENP